MEEWRLVKFKINDVEKVLGEIKKAFSCRTMGMNVKRKLHEGVIVSTAYEAEPWSMVVVKRFE